MTEQENLLGIKPEDLGEPQADIIEAVEAMSKSQSPDEMLKDAAKLLIESDAKHAETVYKITDEITQLIKNNSKSYKEILDWSKESIQNLNQSADTLNKATELVNELYEPLDNDLSELEDKVINLTYYVWGLSAALVITFLVALFK
jgi:CHAT domain-containing protein